MTTSEPTKVLQNNLTDLASLNAYGVVTLANGQRVNVQMTMRHGLDADKMAADFTEFVDFLNRLNGVEFWDGNKPKPETKTEAAPQEAKKYNDRAGTYDDPREFDASLLTVVYDKGKEYYKISGPEGKFPKFPVVVWPEVLDKAGVDREKINPKDGLSLLGWTAKYILNEKGNPGKVIELVKPEFA